MNKQTLLGLLTITLLSVTSMSFTPPDQLCHGYCWAYSYDHKEFYILDVYSYQCDKLSYASATSQWRDKFHSILGDKSYDFSTGANHTGGSTNYDWKTMENNRKEEIKRWEGEGFKIIYWHWEPSEE